MHLMCLLYSVVHSKISVDLIFKYDKIEILKKIMEVVLLLNFYRSLRCCLSMIKEYGWTDFLKLRNLISPLELPMMTKYSLSPCCLKSSQQLTSLSNPFTIKGAFLALGWTHQEKKEPELCVGAISPQFKHCELQPRRGPGQNQDFHTHNDLSIQKREVLALDLRSWMSPCITNTKTQILFIFDAIRFFFIFQ